MTRWLLKPALDIEQIQNCADAERDEEAQEKSQQKEPQMPSPLPVGSGEKHLL
jgi:hypothetical protein